MSSPNPVVYEPPSRAHFEAKLRGDIISGKMRPGDKLPSERALAAMSGLSRPVVREVLKGLVERGHIEVIPARGAIVKAPNSMQLAEMMGSAARRQRATPRHLVQAREVVEAQAARGAAESASPTDVEALRALVRAFDEATTIIERARCDLALHAAISGMCGNPVLEIMFGAIAPLVLELQLRSLSDPVVAQVGGPLHHDVVDAIAQRDADSAAEAMTRHIFLARELYGNDLDLPLDDLAINQLTTLLGKDVVLQDVIDTVLKGNR